MELDRRGFRVFAGVRSETDAQRLRRQASPRLLPVPLDVTDARSIAAAVRVVEQDGGAAGVAGLVNNAGIVVAGPLELLPVEELRRQLDVNVVGQVAVTNAFLPALRKARGRIVNIGSMNGRFAAPYLGAYSASKYAMEAVSDVLRTELRRWRIHVSLVEPGSTATPIWEKSLAAGNALAAEAPANTLAMYRADIEALRRATVRLAQAAAPADKVVRAVVHALTARWPKTRYPIGLETHLLFRAIKWAPDRLWDRILQRAMRLR